MDWRELDQHFGDTSLQYSRLDIQWGDSGEHFRIAGSDARNLIDRFVSLCRIAGARLRSLKSESSQFNEIVSAESDNLKLWYRYLWKFSNRMNITGPGYVTMRDDNGENIGVIFMGSIDKPSDVSRTMCLELYSRGLTSSDSSEQSEKLGDAFELRPSFMGMSLDLKKLFRLFSTPVLKFVKRIKRVGV